MARKENDIDEICAYCEHSVVINESSVCVCKHKGVVRADDRCRRFALDLLKLQPRPKMPFKNDETVFFEI